MKANALDAPAELLRELLQQLEVMDVMEAPDDFYFEFGNDLRKKLREELPFIVVTKVQQEAQKQHREMLEDDGE